MLLALMLVTLFLCRPGLAAASTFEGPVVRVVHVLMLCREAVEPFGAGFALEFGRGVSRRATVVIAGLPSGWEGPAACVALVVVMVIRRHDAGRYGEREG